jgi:FKBP-type peptidyl-prolyl cis-trans isomerase (trigger factor)
MILKHAILLKTPMGQQILTPHTVLDQQLDAVLDNLKGQLQAQGIDPKQLAILTDVELEEGEYEIIDLDEKSVDKEN